MSIAVSGNRGSGKSCLAQAALHNMATQGYETHSLPLGPAADVRSAALCV